MIKKNGLKPNRYAVVVNLNVGIIVVLLSNLLMPINAFAEGDFSGIKEPGSEQTTDSLIEFILPSLSATYVNWHEPSGRELASSSIELSAYGLRVRELGVNSFHEMLHDFNGQRSWLIDHKRSVSHLVQMEETPELESSALKALEVGELETSVLEPGDFSSFLGPVPCGLLTADDQGPGLWRGRRVTAFHCVDESNTVVTIEFIDDIYHIVVYRRSYDGFVDELRGLTDRAFNESHFIPPTEYRTVDKQEFFFGAPALSPYSSDTD